MSKDHAQHNKRLCDHLLGISAQGGDNRYYDWVITTAFYSALHFVDYEMFPLEIGDDTFNTFVDYYNSLPMDEKRSQHKERMELVKKHFTAVIGPYQNLMDLCRNARYSNYKSGEKKAKTARQYLTLIESRLTKPL